MGRSGGNRDWVKGLWMGILCCWAAVGAVVGAEAGPELSAAGKESCSVVLQGEGKGMSETILKASL